jgi:hypothetical protein
METINKFNISKTSEPNKNFSVCQEKANLLAK